MTDIQTLNHLTPSTVLREWNMQTFYTDETLRESIEHTVFWNPSETRSLKVREKTMSHGTVQTEVELADINGEHASLLDLSRTFL